jgi:hypothetical protein
VLSNACHGIFYSRQRKRHPPLAPFGDGRRHRHHLGTASTIATIWWRWSLRACAYARVLVNMAVLGVLASGDVGYHKRQFDARRQPSQRRSGWDRSRLAYWKTPNRSCRRSPPALPLLPGESFPQNTRTPGHAAPTPSGPKGSGVRVVSDAPGHNPDNGPANGRPKKLRASAVFSGAGQTAILVTATTTAT